MADSRTESIQKLKELIEDIDFCMLTTIEGDNLKSRPMSTQQFEFEGDLWFFTSDNTHKVEDITKDPRVNVSYSDPISDRYISVSGQGSIVRDRTKIEELWSPVLKAWFPDGLEDPSLCLLKVSVTQAEYWDTSAGKLVQLIGFIKALATGQEMQSGDNTKFTF